MSMHFAPMDIDTCLWHWKAMSDIDWLIHQHELRKDYHMFGPCTYCDCLMRLSFACQDYCYAMGKSGSIIPYAHMTARAADDAQ
jgi:hypothetical protein